MSQLFMAAATPTGWDLGVEAGSHSSFPGVCDATGTDLSCNFGGMTPADSAITLRVVYQVGSRPVRRPCTSSSGRRAFPADKTKQPRRRLRRVDEISVEADADLAASYVQGAGVTVFDDQSIGRRNPQSTKVTAPAANIPVMVGRRPGNITACQALFSGCLARPRSSRSATARSTGVASRSRSSSTPTSRTRHLRALLHGRRFGELTADCDATHSIMPCKTVTTAQGKTFATLWLTQNGKIFGH